MACFFEKPFKKQVEMIVTSGDLKLLQLFIGIRNPIALLQYNSSFICTKVTLMDTRLHGLYKVQERCLEAYKDSTFLKNDNQTVGNDMHVNSLISNESADIKKEFLANLLLPINKTVFDSISNCNYLQSSDSDLELLSYVRNTDINSMCSTNMEQLNELYKTFVSKSKDSVQNIIKASITNKISIGDEILKLKSAIQKEKYDISKYKDAFKQIKNRAFLRDWYFELAAKVNEDAKSSGHILNEYLPNDLKKGGLFMDKLKNQYPQEIIIRVLKSLVGEECETQEFDYLIALMMNQLIIKEKLDYSSVVNEVIKELGKKITKCSSKTRQTFQLVIDGMTSQAIMKAEQTILDEILLVALNQEKVDCVLLLLCNGASVNVLKENCKSEKMREELVEKFEKPGFTVVEDLYSCMPLMKAKFYRDTNMFKEFTVAGASHSEESYKELNIREIFGLEDIASIFPPQSQIRKIADSISKSDEDKKVISDQIKEKEILIKKLDEEKLLPKVSEFMKSWWKCALTVLCLGLPLVGFLVYESRKTWNTRKNAENELEVAKEDLERITKLFEVLLEYLQSTVVAGGSIYQDKYNLIQKEIENVKKNKDKWVNISSVLAAFEKIQVPGSENLPAFITKSIKFNDLAENIICNRMKHMNELGQSAGASHNPYQLLVYQSNDIEKNKAAVSEKNAEAQNIRDAVSKVDAQSEMYADILRRLKSGDLPLSALEDLKIE